MPSANQHHDDVIFLRLQSHLWLILLAHKNWTSQCISLQILNSTFLWVLAQINNLVILYSSDIKSSLTELILLSHASKNVQTFRAMNVLMPQHLPSMSYL